MPDQKDETADYRRGVGLWLWYPCLLASLVLVFAIGGALVSPVVRKLVIIALSAYGGFLLALFIAILLGFSDVDLPPPSPREQRNVFGLGLLSIIVCTVLFGPFWLIGFVIYLGVVIGVFWIVGRQKKQLQK
jgi:hypothetical protein